MAQPNCEAYRLEGDTLKYKACLKATEALKYYQFTKEYQELMDEALQIDPTYAYAYRQKSVAYLKSGDFVTWKKLIDLAVKYDAESHLGPRAWCRFSWFRDYEGTINDIETLEGLVKYDIGYSTNGDYHLKVVKAMSYGGLNEYEKGIQVLEGLLKDPEYMRVGPGTYDYWCLGFLYFKNNQFDKALACFSEQENVFGFSENSYYTALSLRKLGHEEEFKDNLKKAYDFYQQGRKLAGLYNNKWGALEDLKLFEEINIQ